ncbi:MAG: hypothetical protein HY961_01205 [Ignavibacteriae bacterium]|nr:hypothetical protein [Ignavibacteriota bacterium]
MKRSTLFWILAVVITLASAYYQRVTGPTYPISGKMELGGAHLSYKFERSHSTESNAAVEVATHDPAVNGQLVWKRYKTQEIPRAEPMAFDAERGVLRSELPRQLAAGKLEYCVVLSKGEERRSAPENEPVVIRFKGDVPLGVLIPHVILMFAAMLLSTRTALESFGKEPHLQRLTLWTFLLMAVGGMILGPIVQKYAFDAFWTGIPFGTDLTDNKTLIAFLAWGVALLLVRKNRFARHAALVAALVTLIVFLIPHSMFGSELDYSKQVVQP